MSVNWGGFSCEKGPIEFRMLASDRVEDAMRVQSESMRHECIAIGVGMFEEAGAAAEMQLVFREVVKDGCTVTAVNTESGDVVAVAFNKLHAPLKDGEKDRLATFVESNIKHRRCLGLIGILDDVEGKVNIFDRYNARGAMEIFYIGTATKYQGYGIGKKIVEASIEFARGLASNRSRKVAVCEEIVNEQVIPEVAFAVFASNYSQRIADKLNFECLAEISYEDYVCEGKKLSDRIGNVHKTAKLSALKL